MPGTLHLGAAGSEGGHDIVAWREGAQRAFQCKWVQSFGPKGALAGVEKVLARLEGESEEVRDRACTTILEIESPRG